MRILEWLRKRARRAEAEESKDLEATSPAVEEPLTDERITDALSRAAAEGYGTDDEIVEQVTEALVDEYPDDADLPARVLRLAPQTFDAREALERSWPVPTDCDRLDRAFERLEQAGVVARQDFTCCQTCGHAEIGYEIEQARALRTVRGYTFFHHQDTEGAAEGGTLFLAFGAAFPDGTPKEELLSAEAQIAGEIVAALRAEGLAPSWNGEVTRRIELPLEWRRRRARS